MLLREVRSNDAVNVAALAVINRQFSVLLYFKRAGKHFIILILINCITVHNI